MGIAELVDGPSAPEEATVTQDAPVEQQVEAVEEPPVLTWEQRLKAQMPEVLPPPGSSYRESYPEFADAVVEAIRKHGIGPVSRATGLKFSTIHRWAILAGLHKVNKAKGRPAASVRKVSAKKAPHKSVDRKPAIKVASVHRLPSAGNSLSMNPLFANAAEDKEITAMMIISAALNGLNAEQKRSVATWLALRLASLLSG